MSEIKLNADGGGGSVSLKGPASTTGNAGVNLVLPVDDGTADTWLKSNGSGVTSWAAPTATEIATASGTAGSGTFLRGDNTWAAAGGKVKNVWTFTDSTESSSNVDDYTTMVSTGNIMPSSGTKNLVMVTTPYQIKGHASYNEAYGAMCLFRDTTKLQAELVGINDSTTSIKRDLGIWSCIILDTHGADGSTNIQYHIKAHSATTNWTMYVPNDEYYNNFDSSEDVAVARITVMELDL